MRSQKPEGATGWSVTRGESRRRPQDRKARAMRWTPRAPCLGSWAKPRTLPACRHCPLRSVLSEPGTPHSMRSERAPQPELWAEWPEGSR